MAFKVKNPETKATFRLSRLSQETGVYIKTDGTTKFSSPEEVMTWRRYVEVEGLWRAILHFFDRENLPKVK